MNEGHTEFYAEIHTPESVKLTYAPQGRCLGCDAKLSIYRTRTHGEWDKWCAPCQEKGMFELQCLECMETFPSYGTRLICSRCLVPAQRARRKNAAIIRSRIAFDMWWKECSDEKIVETLQYKDALEMRRAIDKYVECYR